MTDLDFLGDTLAAARDSQPEAPFVETTQIVDVFLTAPHPRQEAVYGTTEPDDALLLSVERNGLLEPPVVRYVAPGEPLVILSGHRRIEALRRVSRELVQAGGPLETTMRVVQCDDHTADDIFISSNAQRVKNLRTIVSEILTMKQILRQSPQSIATQQITDSEIDEIGSRLQIANGARYSDKISASVGISKDKIAAIVTVFDDEYRARQLAIFSEKIPAKARAAELANITSLWDALRTQVLAEEVGLRAAASEVRSFASQAKGKKAGKKIAPALPSSSARGTIAPAVPVPAPSAAHAAGHFSIEIDGYEILCDSSGISISSPDAPPSLVDWPYIVQALRS